MSTILLLFSLLQADNRTVVDSHTPVGRPEVARTFWKDPDTTCPRCHGTNGEGGYGPDLAGRGLTFAEIQRQVRSPWGIMPAFTERQISDQLVSDLTAYFASLPGVEKPGAWSTPLTPRIPPGRRLMISPGGCLQCHTPEIGSVRAVAGCVGADYNWLAKRVYDHPSVYPDGRMGNYSRAHLPEVVMKQIWAYMTEDLGLPVPVVAQISLEPGTPAAGNPTYTLTLKNDADRGGMTGESVQVTFPLPAGSVVESANGTGYEGIVRSTAFLGKDVAVWRFPKLAPGDTHVFTLALTGVRTPSGPALEPTVSWMSPRYGGKPPIEAIARFRAPRAGSPCHPDRRPFIATTQD